MHELGNHPGSSSGNMWERLHAPGSARQLAALRIFFGVYLLTVFSSDVFPLLEVLQPQLRVSTWSLFPDAFVDFVLEHAVGSLIAVGLVSTLMFTIGAGYRLASIVSCVSFVLLYAVYYRVTKSHTEWPYWIFTYLVFSLAPAADTWSVDSAVRKWRGGRLERDSQSYRWPIEMIVLWIATTYTAAGIAKLFPLRAGAEWLEGGVIRWIAMQFYYDSPIHWLLGSPAFDYALQWPWTIMAVLAVATELAAASFFFTRRLYLPVLVGLLGLHGGTYIVTGVNAFVIDALVLGAFLVPPEWFSDYGKDPELGKATDRT